MMRRVLVLMGGWSAEREVSLVGGGAVTTALQSLGYEVSAVDLRDVAALLTCFRQWPDVVFNTLHGRFGEDGCVQGVLNILGIPYTHSGVMASALAMNKVMARRLFAQAGIPVAMGAVVCRSELLSADPLPRPYVVKPLNQGSSLEVRIIRSEDGQLPFADMEWLYREPVLVESFIPGRELTISIMGEQPLAVTEIVTDHVFYDYDAKYTASGSRHILPAPLSTAVTNEALRLALLAHRTLGCRGVSRADFRFDGERLVILEVNTQPGMTPTSLVPEQAAHIGMSFTDLVQWMVENAACDA
ncbi:D-alanine--D-alanine ligase [invertebrate metagenome]|uniref:D-alanine--D-alanine ligase n=1 Tax=invertebrate metagenome TaxID=1711999 RepID=A0A484H671_9ZZZZ